MTKKVTVKVALIDESLGEEYLPAQAHSDDRGFDVRAAQTMILRFCNTQIMPTNIMIQPEEGFSTELHIRSSLGKKNITLSNAVGLIDHGYTNQVGAELVYFGTEVDERLFQLLDPNKPEEEALMQEIIAHKEKFNQGAWLIEQGERIGQLSVHADIQTKFIHAPRSEFTQTGRATGGFGSTGTK